jgi:para-nitrobenzyl esterase
MDGVVEVRSGRLQGVHRNGVWSFSGIPYAAAPDGPRRWRPPQPPEPWAGVRLCDRFGPIAHQAPAFFELSLSGEPDEHSEDCLSLNLWTPAPDTARRPVMVWIHGGSFLSGSGTVGLYRGGMLAREGDVVVVTLNYRLGLLGFLAHPALEEAGQTWLDGQAWTGFGNWGLADQIAALHWVQEHIASFGGDPDNVTVFGESAGGMSISALLSVPAARGLFHRAIVESGPPYTLSAEQATGRAEELAGHLGLEVSRGALERLPADALVAAAADVGSRLAAGGQSGLLMMPVVDGGLLRSPPEAAVASGSASDVALLIGTTRDETSFFTLGNPRFAALDETGLREWVTLLFSDPAEAGGVITRVRQARLGRGEDATPRHLWTAISSEYLFRWPTIRFANAHAAAAGASSDGAEIGGAAVDGAAAAAAAAAGAAAAGAATAGAAVGGARAGGAAGNGSGPGVGTFCYLFTWESPAFGGVLGSCHALEIPFVFGTVHLPGVQPFSGGGDDAFALSAAMRQAWVAFARSGSPGEWPAWDADRRPTMVFGPWPGHDGIRHQVHGPRDAELEAVAGAATAIG